MKVAVIIAEYNPFHNGHLYQILQTKKELKNDYTIAVMSGNFVMRGEPALYNKFIRAKMATLNGIDLVIELSTPYALSSAEYFARAGVSLLNSLNICDYLSFGSEIGDISKLYSIADKLLENETIENIKKAQKKGIPVFSAISEEFSKEEKEILASPNNILGINYIKAIKSLKSDIVPYTVKRINANYNDKTVSGNFASATGIRELLSKNCDIKSLLPYDAYELIKDINPVFEEEFDKLLAYILRVKSACELTKYPDVTEGIENLIKKAADKESVKEIALNIKSKRYAYTRIKRILFNILIDIDKDKREVLPEFARVLAFNDKGKELISILKKKSDIPVFTNITKGMYEKYEALNIDLRASSIYKLGCQDHKNFIDKILL